jgi:hypothetical protein
MISSSRLCKGKKQIQGIILQTVMKQKKSSSHQALQFFSVSQTMIPQMQPK